MRLQVGRVDHNGLPVAALGGQSLHHPGEDPHVTPPLPTVVERLRRAILTRGVTPTQAIAIDEDYAAQYASIIHTRLAMALRKERRQPLHLLVGQPEKVAHLHPRQFGSLNHAGRAASRRLIGPDPSDANQNKGEIREEHSDAIASGDTPINLIKEVFDEGVKVLVKCGVSENSSRRFLGKLRKNNPGQDNQILQAIMDCSKTGAVEPISWITARLRPPPLTRPFDLSNFGKNVK